MTYIHVIYRINQAKHVIHILVAASQEYVNTYSTRKVDCRASVTTDEAVSLQMRIYYSSSPPQTRASRNAYRPVQNSNKTHPM